MRPPRFSCFQRCQMEDLISVVVPVYNTKEYLANCVKSLTEQTYHNLEIILIDDGSTDGSSALCDELAKSEDRIVVLHRENQGVSKARYDAVLSARGKYISFVDSDDTVDADYIETLYLALMEFQADAATCTYRKIYTGENNRVEDWFVFSNGPICLSAEGSFQFIYYEKNCPLSMTTKLFRTDILKTISPSDLKIGEDSYITQKYFLLSKRIAHTGKAKYNYIQRESSAVHASDSIQFYDYVKLYDMLMDEVLSACPKIQSAYISKMMENYLVVLLRMKDVQKNYPEEMAHIAENIKKYRFSVLTDSRAELRTRAACLLSYFGLSTVTNVYQIIQKLLFGKDAAPPGSLKPVNKANFLEK